MKTDPRSQQFYVVRLQPPAAGLPPEGAPARLSGQLEHVLSGRCHDFDDGLALLACLAHEQLQVAAATAAGPAAPTPTPAPAPIPKIPTRPRRTPS